MILTSDFNSTVIQIANRHIAPMMTELHLVGLSTQSQRKNLMAKTDSEHRHFPE